VNADGHNSGHHYHNEFAAARGCINGLILAITLWLAAAAIVYLTVIR
jgi:hypothetical protein